jgi:hypothetical protein
MRTGLIVLAVALAMPAHAQKNRPADRAGALASHETCVEVEIGGSRSYDCINEKLRRQVDQINPVLNAPPLDARSGDTKIGIFNEPAVRQQYGQNFGKSVFPFRPPPPVFGTPLGR